MDIYSKYEKDAAKEKVLDNFILTRFFGSISGLFMTNYIIRFLLLLFKDIKTVIHVDANNVI